MLYGIWYMVYVIWYMVYGLWYMVYGGISYMVYGIWYIPCLLHARPLKGSVDIVHKCMFKIPAWMICFNS